MSAVLLSFRCCLPAELLVAMPALAFGACRSSLLSGWEHKPERCDAKPKPTSSLGHLLILCRGSVDGLLMEREVGVAQRHLRSSCYWREFGGKLSSAMARWLHAVLVVRPVWPGLALPQGKGGRAAGAWGCRIWSWLEPGYRATCQRCWEQG